MRYYIDTDDGDARVIDEAGFDLPGPLEARTTAIDALPDMARQKIPNGDDRTFSVSVRNEAGGVIYSAELVMTGTWHIPRPQEG
ncbi:MULTISPECIES: hypothetical protein [unclassified Methylobacterium]|uniref:DUF6894 family protein n=1 Tax=unclassified Methylobacterium TaxID=2615210 RepID=UPI001FEFE117|nr:MULTISPECIES: hypothetical protein [unclassified Methylobacterium]